MGQKDLRIARSKCLPRLYRSMLAIIKKWLPFTIQLLPFPDAMSHKSSARNAPVFLHKLGAIQSAGEAKASLRQALVIRAEPNRHLPYADATNPISPNPGGPRDLGNVNSTTSSTHAVTSLQFCLCGILHTVYEVALRHI